MENGFIDFHEDLDITYRNLPHWHQDGKFQYLTCRLADSLPNKVLQIVKDLKEAFMACNPKPWDEKTLQRYHNIVSEKAEHYLSRGYGDCILKNPEVRKILEDAIFFYHGEKFEVNALVIMPNHLHIVLRMLGDNKIEDVLPGILRFSSVKINKLLQREGRVWMKDYFDRMIRSYEHYKHCITYIKNNPKGLKKGEYTLIL